MWAHCIFSISFIIILSRINDINALTHSPQQSNELLPCPNTKWSAIPHRPNRQGNPSDNFFLQTIDRPDELSETTSECTWLHENGEKIMDQLENHGALLFTNFQSPKSKNGFRSFCDSLPLDACEDALASIGVRSLLSKSNGVYKAVDSESLSETFIGLHNDCTFTLAPPFAAFCCFQQATNAGEFLLADGKEVLAALDDDIMKKLYKRNVRVRVAALPTPFLIDAEENVRNVITALIQAIVGWGLQTFVPKLALELSISDDYSMLQILEPLKSPLNHHPKTGQPTFFSGIHSQSAYLQQKRAADAFSGVAVTDVFYGEMHCNDKTSIKHKRQIVLEPIEADVLDHIEDVMNQHTKRVLMRPGDVVLLDSYQTLHGRETFQGSREHGVVWLTNCE